MSSGQPEGSETVRAWAKFEPGSLQTSSVPEAGHRAGFTPFQTDGDNETPPKAFRRFGVEESTDETDDDVRESANERPIADLEQEAYEKGFAQGEKDGFELGEQRALKTLETIEGLLDEMGMLKSEIVKQYEKEILETIFSIAERITKVQIGMNSEVVRDTVLNALRYVIENHTVRLRINPDDFSYIEGLRRELFES